MLSSAAKAALVSSCRDRLSPSPSKTNSIFIFLFRDPLRRLEHMYSAFVRRAAVVLMASPLALGAAVSQKIAEPQPTPLPPPIVAPVDTPYNGTIALQVDLTDTARRVISVHESIPVNAGRLTLLYPRWIPGNHSPTGPISKLAGLVITANGQRLAWVRDRVDVFAFHVDVPAGVKTLEVQYMFLGSLKANQGRMSISNEIADLQWNTVVLYPAGHFSRQIEFAPTVKLPEGWKYASALEVESETGSFVYFKKTSLNTLVDSPMYAGVNFKRVDLSTDPANKVYLDVFADKPGDLAITDEQIEVHKKM